MENTFSTINGFLEWDLFGMPDWWCLASAVFVTLIIALLIYVYFKGRRMMRDRERITGVRRIQCSACGIIIRDDSVSCPGCGSIFSNDRFVCPRCKKETKKEDRGCPNCNARLRRVDIRRMGLMKIDKDQDLRKLKGPLRKRDLEECPVCSALKDPGTRCPVCKERR